MQKIKKRNGYQAYEKNKTISGFVKGFVQKKRYKRYKR